MKNLLLTDLLRGGQSSRSTPCVRVTSPDAVVEEFFLGDIDNASDRAAQFLDQELPEDQPTFFYMGPSDLRYFIFVVMLPSPGNTVPANRRLFETVGAKTLLFAPEAARALAPLLEAARRDGVRAAPTPSYAELMSREPAAAAAAAAHHHHHRRPTRSFDEVRDLPVLGLHTSGTSGDPRPIYWTHGGIATLASHSDTTPGGGGGGGANNLLRHVFAPGEVVMMPFPPYHMGGMSPLFFSVFYGHTHVMPAAGVLVTPESVSAMLRRSGSTTAWLAPSLLEDMLDYPPGLDTLATMKNVVFGGGPMNPAKGERLSKLVPRLCSCIGSTEGGPAHLILPPDGSHWSEFNFVDVGQRMEEVEPGVFELVYPNTELTRRCQLYFHAYPELREYRTRDLFAPVPGRRGSGGGSGWWAYRGRADSWVTLSSALKMDPTGVESAVGAHRDVRGALVAGDGRHRPCLLVELRGEAAPAGDEEREEALAALWPAVERANEASPRFGRIPRELVLLATREKPFPRASKGTIQRRLAVDAYADEIDDLYAKAERGLLARGLPPLETLDQRGLEGLLRRLYSGVLERTDEIGVDDDVFARGIDSLGVMTVSSRLRAALRRHGVEEAKLEHVGLTSLYSAPTIRSAAEALSGVLSGPGRGPDPRAAAAAAAGNPGAGRPETASGASEVLELIEKYKAEVQKLLESAPAATGGRAEEGGGPACRTILLTGSTGSLGCHLLVALAARPDVKKVICLNRGADAEARQARALEARGLPPLPLPPPRRGQGGQGGQGGRDRVVFLRGELDEERLGLGREDYALVARETTAILHNAWPVNFLAALPRFEPQLRGLLNLMGLALSCPGRRGRGAALLFVSSVSAGLSAGGARRRVPEAVLGAAAQAGDLLPQGYARSKYVSEQMLEAFAGGLARPPPVAVLRVGQVCGPRRGAGPWNRWEWFPSLVLSSRHLGAAPDDIGQDVNWVPVDELAGVLSDLVDHVDQVDHVHHVDHVQPAAADGHHDAGGHHQAGEASPAGVQVFNVVNPSSSAWRELLPALRAVVPETIPPSEWVARLERSAEGITHEVAEQNPGAKLVAFYRGALVRRPEAEPIYDVHNLTRGSARAARLGPITRHDLERWMGAWGL